MSDITLGSIITGTPPQRDAIHIAVFAGKANETLVAAQRVGIIESGPVPVISTKADHIGIVDPYLTGVVKKDQVVLVCLFQNTVTGMRHEWMHPSFGNEKDQSIIWMTNKAKQWGHTYSTFLVLLNRVSENGGYCFGDDDAPDNFYNDQHEIWRHYAIITGKHIDYGDFSYRCAC